MLTTTTTTGEKGRGYAVEKTFRFVPPDVWGPLAWGAIHGLLDMVGTPCMLGKDNIRAMPVCHELVWAFGEILPCDQCRKNFKVFWTAKPNPDPLGQGVFRFQWAYTDKVADGVFRFQWGYTDKVADGDYRKAVWKLHNDVNRKLGKPVVAETVLDGYKELTADEWADRLLWLLIFVVRYSERGGGVTKAQILKFMLLVVSAIRAQLPRQQQPTRLQRIIDNTNLKVWRKFRNSSTLLLEGPFRQAVSIEAVINWFGAEGDTRDTLKVEEVLRKHEYVWI